MHIMRHQTAMLILAGVLAFPARALDLSALWDFRDPARSEANFRRALQQATGDDALILKTQIARTYSLRGQFDTARALLHPLEAELARSSAEVAVRYWLELGRTHASHRHAPGSIDTTAADLARRHFTKALEIARGAQLDGLAIDAIHMFAFVDTEPADQLKWAREALAAVEMSRQPDAKRWEPSIRSNLGEALFDVGRFGDALDEFRRALALRSRSGPATVHRDNEWHIARPLRVLGRTAEAMEMQRRLKEESEAQNERRHYIYDELALLFEVQGDKARALHFRGLADAARRK
jgi:tetratricopeptide (TPR) repeat protein